MVCRVERKFELPAPTKALLDHVADETAAASMIGRECIPMAYCRMRLGICLDLEHLGSIPHMRIERFEGQRYVRVLWEGETLVNGFNEWCCRA